MDSFKIIEIIYGLDSVMPGLSGIGLILLIFIYA